MRNVLLAYALVFGTAVGCSSSYTPGEYAAVGYRSPSHGDAGAAPARNRSRTHAAARRQTAPAPTTSPVEAARPGPQGSGAGPS